MASVRLLALAVCGVGAAFVLSGCAPAASTADSTYETAIASVVTAESTAGGRAVEVDREQGAWKVRVAVDERTVEVRVAPDGMSPQSSRDDDRLGPDDRAALDAAITTLADALRIAAARLRDDASVDEAGIDDGAWKVEFDGGGEVVVSTSDGSVMRTAP